MTEQLEKLLHETHESVILDFKRQINLKLPKDKREFAKDVSAFANTKGGHIVFGKEDPKKGGKIVGINPITFDSEKMHQIVTSGCDPSVDFEVKLEEYDSKFFVVVTIPESNVKPHKMTRYPQVVFKRRGDTTDIASPIEITRMVKETQDRIKGTKDIKDEETEQKIGNYEENATISSMFSLFLMTYITLRLLTFWGSDTGLGIGNWFNPWLFFIALLVVAAFIIPMSIFGKSVKRPMLKHLRFFSLHYILVLGIFVITVVIVNALVFLYPISTRIFFQYKWLTYFIMTSVLFVIGLTSLTLSYFPNSQFFSKLSNPLYERNFKGDIETFIQEINQCARFFRKKICFIGLLLILLFPLFFVVSDLQWGVFIPQYQESDETLTYDYYVGERIYLFIYSERITPDIVKTTPKFYQLFQKQHVINPADFPLLNTIRIPNLTNITTGSTENPRMSSTLSDIYSDSVGAVYVSLNKTLGVTYEFIPSNYNCSFIDFDISKINEPFSANITYWKEIENVDIEVTASQPIYHDFENGTWLETYSYSIENNEDTLLELVALDFDRFIYENVNAETTKVYSRGEESFTSFVFSDRLTLYQTIGSSAPLNLTITVQSNNIN